MSRRLKAEGTHHLILIIPKSHDCADNVNRVREQDPNESHFAKRCKASCSARTSSDPDISQLSRLRRQCQSGARAFARIVRHGSFTAWSQGLDKRAHFTGSGKALFAGTSTGANLVAAIDIGKRIGPDGTIVMVMCDSGIKYLSTALYGQTASGTGVSAIGMQSK
jgi:hypothetical protein